jgi:adenylate cyclase
MVTAEELAELVPCSLDNTRRLEKLGLLNPENGLFPSSDVHVIRLMDAFEQAGISLDDVARAVAAGGLSFPLHLFMPEPEGLPATYEGLAAEIGRTPECLRRLSTEFGLPPPEDDRIRTDDAEMLALVLGRIDLADDEELSRYARLYGGTIQRLIASGLQFFDQVVRRRVETFDLTDPERDRLIYEQGAGFADLNQRVVPWLQRRHREHAVLEYLVTVLEEWMEERGIMPPQPRKPPAIAFLDLTGYTAFSEEEGDRAAAELASELAIVVREAANAHGGRPVKWLGDGVMFHFTDPGEAIVSALDLIERTEQATSVPARMGVNAGAVIAQEGDYFGRTVNVASRIADFARPREVLVSDEARRSAGDTDVEFELVGDVPLRGVAKAVRLHRATRART